MGDFNGDGNPDSATIAGAGVLVQLLAGDGSVLSSQTYPVGFSTGNTLGIHMIAADFNGDGEIDLAVSNSGTPGTNPGGIAILLGAGNGTFGAPIAVSAGANPQTLVAADFNGDGKLDIAVGNYASGSSSQGFPGPGTISVLSGNGNGTFGVPVTYPTGEDQSGLPNSLIALDLNGDGLPDLAAANRNDNSISTWINSNGKFGSPLVTHLATIDDNYLAYADFDHDGKLDVIAASHQNSALVMLLGKGDGSFQTPAFYAIGNQPASLGVAPLQDGNTLIVSADSLTGDAWTTVVSPQGVVGAPPLIFLGGSLTGVAAVDLNGDGTPDAVAVGGSQDVSVVLSKSAAYQAPVNYSLGGTSPVAVALGDLNKDGKPDVVVANGAGSVSVLLGNGDGTLRTPLTMPLNLSPTSLTLGDFNGDGKLDAAVASYGSSADPTAGGGVAVLPGNGDGTFQAPAILTMNGLHPEAVASADLNGDGIQDLAVMAVGTSGQPATLTIFLGQAGGKFQAARTFPLQTAGGVIAGIAIGDLNGDGKPDIVAFGFYNANIDVMLGDGTGSFHEAAALPTTAASNSAALALADVNGDGKLDIVTTGAFLAGNGDGTFQAEQQFLAASFATSVAPATFAGRPGLFSVGQTGTLVATALLTPAVSPLSISANVSAASSTVTNLAPSSIATAYGSDLATQTATAGAGPLSTTLGQTTVTITDSTGAQLPAPLFYVSSTQVNYEVPAAAALGAAQVTIANGNGDVGSAGVQIAKIAPGVFVLNPASLVAADAIVVSNGSQQLENVFQVAASGAIVAAPINVNGAPVYLAIFGTGIANAKNVTATVAGQSVPVLFWGAQGEYVGLDQVNIGPLPAALQGRGQVAIVLTADGLAANTVNIAIQ
ncbi:MAG TPA: FG-GAP-like repeat-containing protein [Bryobacteraceae bacterium]|nr:FG-GAP-like repeat-containing protein [Bryobacteraceae bacterium]